VSRSPDDCDVLVVAAFAPELVGFQGLLGRTMQGEVGPLTVAAKPVGIGLVSAAAGMATLLHVSRPRAVVLVGTCGAYPGTKLSIGDVVVARSVWLVEPAVVDDEAVFPEPMSARVEPHIAMRAAIAAAGARSEDVATTLGITTSDALAARLGRDSETAVEHLEAFAVASSCARQSVPFAAVLGVANAVGSTGRAEWRANHVHAANAAASYLVRWLHAGAPGVPHL
jgi:futalosine hydrolase